MEKFFFFFSSSSYKAPSPFRYHDRHVYTRERSWWKREKEKERGGGTEKRARREERRDLKRYAEYRLWWMPQPVATMFSLHWSALLRNISPPLPPSPPPSSAHPSSGRFSNPSPNRDWTLVHVSMRIRGIHFAQTGGGARAGECNIDNNYGTGSVCRITNRRQDFGQCRNIELVDKRVSFFLTSSHWKFFFLVEFRYAKWLFLRRNRFRA